MVVAGCDDHGGDGDAISTWSARLTQELRIHGWVGRKVAPLQGNDNSFQPSSLARWVDFGFSFAEYCSSLMSWNSKWRGVLELPGAAICMPLSSCGGPIFQQVPQRTKKTFPNVGMEFCWGAALEALRETWERDQLQCDKARQLLRTQRLPEEGTYREHTDKDSRSAPLTDLVMIK
eukprot:4733919-Amphidinium_carterae.1